MPLNNLAVLKTALGLFLLISLACLHKPVIQLCALVTAFISLIVLLFPHDDDDGVMMESNSVDESGRCHDIVASSSTQTWPQVLQV